MTTKIMKYIWTYPAAVLIFMAVGDDLPTWNPFYVLASILMIGGLVGYITDVIV